MISSCLLAPSSETMNRVLMGATEVRVVPGLTEAMRSDPPYVILDLAFLPSSLVLEAIHLEGSGVAAVSCGVFNMETFSIRVHMLPIAIEARFSHGIPELVLCQLRSIPSKAAYNSHLSSMKGLYGQPSKTRTAS